MNTTTSNRLISHLENLGINTLLIPSIYGGDRLNVEHSGNWLAYASLHGKQFPNVAYAIIPHTSYGDYCGSSVDRANHNELLEQFPEIVHTWQEMYSTNSAYVLIADLFRNRELYDTVAGLSEYPLINDESMYFAEMEMESDDWNCWIESDLRKELSRLGDIAGTDNENDQEEIEAIQKYMESIDNMNSDKFFELYCKAKEKANIEWHCESGTSGYVDVEKLAEFIWNNSNLEQIEKFAKN